jgi:conjugal transfer pilus assembly protein TraF
MSGQAATRIRWACAAASLLCALTARGQPDASTRTPAPPPDSDKPNGYWRDTWRGWHFYELPEPPPPVPTRTPSPPKPVDHARPAPPAPPAAPARPAELLAFEQLQRALEDARHIAIMQPTEPNVRRYMQLEAAVTNRASAFADMAQRIAWADPALDPTVQGRPVNARALEVFDHLQSAGRGRSVAALAADHVLLFFFRGDCPYCHAFAPTLEAFQQRHGLKVLAISLDGGSLPGFADQRMDNGIARSLQVTQVPALFLAQPFTGTLTPIGFGVLSEAQLLERITLVAAGPPQVPSWPAGQPPQPGIPPRQGSTALLSVP